MDIAYDHIQEEVLSPDASNSKDKKEGAAESSLSAEFAQAYNAISSSSWGARFGALVGSVRKQGESVYEGARHDYTAASSQASKGISDIINRTRSLSLTKSSTAEATSRLLELGQLAEADRSSHEEDSSQGDHTSPESEGVLSRFRSEAYKRLKDIEKAEDAADEALLKFGTNIRNFLHEAVSIAPPTDGEEESGADGKPKILYQSRDHEGKRVFHTTRFDAQLHVIHTSMDSFAKDPISPEYSKWNETFEVEKKTDEISSDLEKHKDLRAAMEGLVPDQVKYEDFWKRYYFLRHVIESEERGRKEMLKGASAEPDEEIAWDEDSETEAQTGTKATSNSDVNVERPASMESSSTLHATNTTPNSTAATNPAMGIPSIATPPIQPAAESQHSNDQHSQPDSDASYDVVSGAPSKATSHAPGSPKDGKKATAGGGEESDEEDWE